MAVNAYLILEGLDGPSETKAKAIDIYSFSFDASNSTLIGAGAESKTGKGEVSEVRVMKHLDKTSPNLFNYCVSGTVVKKATLCYDKQVGDKPTDYFKIEMTNALITKVEYKGSSENPTEDISIAFEKVKLGYNPEKPGSGGKSLEGFVEKGWDVKKVVPF